MLKLTTNDLVTRARQLADLENSAFISWNENINLCNEAFQKCYQKAINRGEKFFVKEMEIGGNAGIDGFPAIVPLPTDFYQLEGLTDRWQGRPVVRRTVNDANAQLCYEIKNGSLYIYGHYTNPLTLSYYPIPKTLYYPNVSNLVSVPEELKEVTFYDCYKNLIVWIKNSVLYSYDTLNATKKSYDLSEDVDLESHPVNGLYAGANGIFVQLYDSSSCIYDWDLELVTTTDVKVLFYDDNKNLCVVSDGVILDAVTEDEKAIPEDRILDYIDTLESFTVGTFTTVKVYGDNENYEIKKKLVAIAENVSIKVYLEGSALETVLIGKSVRTLMYYNDEFFGCSKVNDVFKCTNGKVETLSRKCVGINGINTNTGYGYTTLNGFIHSIFADTEVEVPNNVYVQMIAYTMAISYKAKQNAPVDALATLYNEAETQFFDSLPQDDYQPLRIQSVY